VSGALGVVSGTRLQVEQDRGSFTQVEVRSLSPEFLESLADIVPARPVGNTERAT
jgi:hypothetical protein